MDLTPRDVVLELIEHVWNLGDVTAVGRLVAPVYTIHHDPGDAWDGQPLDHEAFAQRLTASRAPFPDQRFTVHETVAEGGRVAVRWQMDGTHLGAMPELGLASTGRRVTISGMTIYEVVGGRVTGHWQQVDRLAVYRQLRTAQRPG